MLNPRKYTGYLWDSQSMTLQDCSLGSCVANKRCPLSGGGQVIIWKTWLWTVINNLIRVCHAQCKIQTFLFIQRIVPAKATFFLSLPYSSYFSNTVRSRTLVDLSLTRFYIVVLYIVEHILVLKYWSLDVKIAFFLHSLYTTIWSYSMYQ